jgi:hypothetical protein
MKMRPCIFWKRTDSENESVHLIIEGARMIGHGDAHIMRAGAFDDILFGACPVDRDLFWRHRIGAAVFDGVAGSNGDFASGLERLNTRGFARHNGRLAATDIRPIACRIPTNRKAVNKYVCLLPEIENGDRTMHSRQQKLQVISGELSAARSMKIDQTSGRRRLTVIGLKRIISRSKVSRQSAGKL